MNFMEMVREYGQFGFIYVLVSLWSLIAVIGLGYIFVRISQKTFSAPEDQVRRDSTVRDVQVATVLMVISSLYLILFIHVLGALVMGLFAFVFYFSIVNASVFGDSYDKKQQEIEAKSAESNSVN
jgi:uncharacterized membrane protein